MAARLNARTAAETQGAIVDLVRSNRVISRVELAEQSGLTGASISRIVKRLIERGLLVEVGQGDPTGGKRRTLLELNPQGRFAVGVAVDEEHITSVVINLTGEVVAQAVSAGLGRDEPGVVVARMADDVRGLLAQAGIGRGDVAGVGLAGPGRLDPSHVALRSSRRTSEWEQFAIEPALEEAVGLPVLLEHDYVCAALGEFWVGRVPATSNMACFYLATGFGCGFLLGGEVYHGSSHNAGEVGHLVLDVNGPPCWCGSRGCLEAVAGPRRVVEQVVKAPSDAERLGLAARPDTVRSDFARIARAAVAGDPACAHVVADSARYVAAAVLSLVNAFDVDRVTLSGPGFADAGVIYAQAARAAVDGLSFVRDVHPVAIEVSQLGLEAAAIGAATVALHANLTRAGRPRH